MTPIFKLQEPIYIPFQDRHRARLYFTNDNHVMALAYISDVIACGATYFCALAS